MLLFSILSSELKLKELRDEEKIESIFYDLMIILKDLNNGQNFEITYLTDLFKFSKLLGFLNINNETYTKEKSFLNLEKNKKSKSYLFITFNNILILFKNEKIYSIIILSSTVYFYQADPYYKNIHILSQSGKDKVILFKNKTDYIKDNKYDKLSLCFTDIESFNEVYNCLNI
jgi:hypothetical protein